MAESKSNWLWIRDDKGVTSVTVTFTTVSFFVTTLAFLASIFEHVQLFGQEVAFRPFDVSACSAYFIPILTLYFGRKYTKARYGADKHATPASEE